MTPLGDAHAEVEIALAKALVEACDEQDKAVITSWIAVCALDTFDGSDTTYAYVTAGGRQPHHVMVGLLKSGLQILESSPWEPNT